jgi:PAS domain S-box-containing protein
MIITCDNQKSKEQLIKELVELRKRVIELENDRTTLRHDEEIVGIIKNSPIGLFIIQDGKFKLINDKFRESIEGTSDDILATDSMKFVIPEDREMVRENAIKMLKGERTQPYRYRILSKTGETRWMLEGLASIQYGGKRAVLGHSMDITELSIARERLAAAYGKEREAREELEDEIKRRVEFTRALVHELKTPLTPIMSSSELLVSGLKEEPWLSVARNIQRGAANLNRRIDELLDMARGEVGLLRLQPTKINASRLLLHVGSEMASVAAANGQILKLDIPGTLPEVWGDVDRIRQIVLNLLINASKFTPEGGTITLYARQHERMLLIEVRDTGRGIPDYEQINLFQPYHRRVGDVERLSGLGLGLSLCKMLVEMHGGRIWAESEVGKGSTFAFTIPLVTPEQEVDAERASAGSEEKS